jgi:hypothetical protein
MPEPQQSEPTPADKRLDRLLLGSMGLSVFAAAFEVIVGFSVAHWITLTAMKTPGYVVCATAFVLCLIAALMAFRVRVQVTGTDDTQPHHRRRLFMADLNLLVAGLVAILVFAGTLVLVTLRPNS